MVFNDVIRCREEACRSGAALTPTEVQRRVITEAKTRESREWLSGVASVALVQSVRDAHRAYQNFFNSVKGKRRGRKVGRPRFKSRKDTRQSFRLTRSGFSVRPDGRLYLAKVGDVRVRWSRDLPSVPSSVTKPSGLRGGPEHRGHGPQSTPGAGHLGCWVGAVRAFADRWLPSSKTCSTCGHILDTLPLKIRIWCCPVCQTMHDRDANAARNILAAGRAERRNARGALIGPLLTR